MVADYIPIITTLFCAFFLKEIVLHYALKPKTYLLWWSIGVLTYAIGTTTESIHALAGWSELNLRLWFISGALLGGYPLAQGTVYLLMPRKFAHLSAAVWTAVIVVAAYFVWQSPMDIAPDFTGELTGKHFKWTWVRRFSPFINGYSVLFLVGGAIYSAVVYARKGQRDARFMGNIYIAVGAILPGIGGTFTRYGHVEVLFVTELLGVLAIYRGYRLIKKHHGPSAHQNQQTILQ